MVAHMGAGPELTSRGSLKLPPLLIGSVCLLGAESPLEKSAAVPKMRPPAEAVAGIDLKVAGSGIPRIMHFLAADLIGHR